VSQPKKPIEGKVLPALKKVPGLSAFDALTTIVEETSAYLKLREEERTKRANIEAYAKLETDRIRGAERVLKQYFDQVFAERAHTIDELFARLDAATERGDDGSVAGTLSAIVDLAKSSPLATMGDLGELRKALDDPDHVWEL
jgi:hypothetical protein